MGRILTPVTMTDPDDPAGSIRFEALVDTGSSLVVLRGEWKARPGLPHPEIVERETADPRMEISEVAPVLS